MSDLLPCPFCGAEAILKDRSYVGHLREEFPMFIAFCSNSACIAHRNQSTSRDAVVAAWNLRPPPKTYPM